MFAKKLNIPFIIDEITFFHTLAGFGVVVVLVVVTVVVVVLVVVVKN